MIKNAPCKKCGKLWDVKRHKTVMRDKECLKCTCGEVLIQWNGAVFYTATEVK